MKNSKVKRIFRFYGQGLISTVIVMIIFGVISFIVSSTSPIDGFLRLFVPERFIFPGIGLLFVVLFIPPLLTFLNRGRIRKAIGRTVKKIPVLNLLWTEEIPSVLEKAIPVAARFCNTIIYGFCMGRTVVHDETGFVKSKELLSIFPPSVPIPFTSVLPMDFEPDDVREVEIVGNPGRNQARIAIIQNKCFSLGQPLAQEVRYKIIDKKEINNLPVLTEKAEKENQQIAKRG